jgi:hypothetical protein
MEKEIFYDNKTNKFYYSVKSRQYIEKNTVMKRFLGNNLLYYYSLNNENETGFLLDLESEIRIDFHLFKTYNLITNLKFSENFKYCFQSFFEPDILEQKINVLIPENFIGLFLVENDFKDNYLSKVNSTIYLVNRHDFKTYRFLANNIYENGNICYGDNFKIPNFDFLNLAEKGKKIFEFNKCNGDLSFPYSCEFLNFRIEKENLIHDPIKFPLTSIGLTDSKNAYIRKIMEKY